MKPLAAKLRSLGRELGALSVVGGSPVEDDPYFWLSWQERGLVMENMNAFLAWLQTESLDLLTLTNEKVLQWAETRPEREREAWIHLVESKKAWEAARK